MKVKSFKSFMFIGVCVWGATGALAFWAGKTLGAKASAAALAAAAHAKNASARNSLNFISGNASSKDPGAPLDSDLLSKKGKLDAADIARWAASLDPKDFANEMDKLQALPAGAKRDAMLAALYDTWAKQDPAAFLQASSKMTNPSARSGGLDGRPYFVGHARIRRRPWIGSKQSRCHHRAQFPGIRFHYHGLRLHQPDGSARARHGHG